MRVTTGAGTGVINFNQALAFGSSSTTYDFLPTITGAITVEQNGPGTTRLVPGAHNTYTGGTFINAGVLQLASANALPTTGAVTITGGSLDIDGNHVSSDTLDVEWG